MDNDDEVMLTDQDLGYTALFAFVIVGVQLIGYWI